MSKPFCNKCGIYVDYSINRKQVNEYIELYAFCVKCKNVLDVPRINMINVYLREKAFSEQGE